MASASDILEVRRNTNEPDVAVYPDILIGEYIDSLGVAGASARIWRLKAAKYADLVDVTEAGATERFDQLHKKALAQADYWDLMDEASRAALAARSKVKSIGRDRINTRIGRD